MAVEKMVITVDTVSNVYFFCTMRGVDVDLLGRGAILAFFSRCDNLNNNLTKNVTDVVQTTKHSLVNRTVKVTRYICC